MKEVEVLPDDSKSAECIRQLEQVILYEIFTKNHEHISSDTIVHFFYINFRK